MSTPAVEVQNLRKVYGCGHTEVIAVRDASLTIARGEVDLVTANSGGNNGLREATDAVIALLGNGREVIDHRVQYSETYQRYLSERQAVGPEIVRNAR